MDHRDYMPRAVAYGPPIKGMTLPAIGGNPPPTWTGGSSVLADLRDRLVRLLAACDDADEVGNHHLSTAAIRRILRDENDRP